MAYPTQFNASRNEVRVRWIRCHPEGPLMMTNRSLTAMYDTEAPPRSRATS